MTVIQRVEAELESEASHRRCARFGLIRHTHESVGKPSQNQIVCTQLSFESPR